MPGRSILLTAVAAAFFCTVAGAAPAPVVRQLADLRTTPNTANALFQGDAYRIGNVVLFFADDASWQGSIGLEPWVTDGTAEGTRLLGDIWPGASPGFVPTRPARIGDVLLFEATDGSTGRELWRSDPTGVRLVKDIFPGITSSDPSTLTELGGNVVFSALDPAAGRELFTTDGTAAGTSLLVDVRPGPAGSSPAGFTLCNGRVFFTADDGTHGAELWSTDGTAGGTALVKDLAPGAAGAAPSILACFGDRLFFSADDGGGARLWRTDGSAAQTAQVSGSPPSPAKPAVSGGALYFTGTSGGHAELFRTTDGLSAAQLTADGKDIARLVDAGGKLFVFYDSSLYDELYRWDDTIPAVVQLKPQPFAVDLFRVKWWPASVAAVGGTLFFTADDGSGGGPAIWKSDGTGPGTVKVTAKVSALAMFTDGTDVLILGSDAGKNLQLWRCDGSDAGTTLVKTIATAPAASTPQEFVGLGGATYFSALDDDGARELYRSDGTGATRVRGSTSAWSAPQGLTVWNGSLYFAARTSTAGVELYRSDGTLGGTQLVRDIASGTGNGILGTPQLVGSGSWLFFPARSSTTAGTELWATNGTTTNVVKDLITAGSSYPDELTDCGGVLFFATYANGVFGRELFRTDGTALGTALVVDLDPAVSSDPKELTPFGGLVYFAATGPSGRELYRTDGTAEGTARVADLCPGACSSNPERLVVADSALFFLASDAGGLGLWVSDGTESGTSLLHRFDGVQSLATVDGVAYLAASDGIHGYELWRSDGTARGTALVQETLAGASGGLVGGPLVPDPVRGLVFFPAADEAGGMELWVSNGTAKGTFPVADLHPGPLPSSPAELAVVGDLLYFSADDGVTRREPWVLELPSLGDMRPPQVTCPPAPDPVNAGTAAGAPVSFGTATAADDVTPSGDLVITWSAESGSTFLVGATTVTVTATDAAGNEGSCSFDVAVTGTPPPSPPPSPSPETKEGAPSGCGCGAGGGAELGGLLALVLVWRARRFRSCAPHVCSEQGSRDRAPLE